MSTFATASFLAQLNLLDGRQQRIDGRTVAESVESWEAWGQQFHALNGRIQQRMQFGQRPELPDVVSFGAYLVALYAATVAAATVDVAAGDDEAAA